MSLRFFCQFWLVFGLLLSGSLAWAGDDARLARLLEAENLQGCVVVLNLADHTRIHSNEAACGQRHLPASTFKIPNALIALEIGVTSETEIFPWDRKPRHLPTWEKDLNLQEAMAVSAVPVYQEIARRIGSERMAEWLTRIDYGNREIGSQVDRFWLDGPLKISPIEQVAFLGRVASGQAPFSDQTRAALKRLLPTESFGAARLLGKTGFAPEKGEMHGWYVGWVERDGKPVWAVAVHLFLLAREQLPLRQSMGREALRIVGAIDP
ncbi:Beta-lactamase OXA-133 [Candidatus Magnetaquicoccaceae bacterium FCR-1]|uniref:Beta-lactamase n=1 Tax=Candidatus Magnetaquiglobus chichijimensis TaxID=3141448 RepID=A0ABQ0C7T0_9PROT